MKISIVYIVSLLLLCSSCQIGQQSHEFFEQKPRMICIGSDGWSTFQVVLPEYWKLVDAQLKLNQSNKEFNLHLAYDRSRGIEKISLPIDSPLKYYTDDVQFCGANRVDGLVFLHFNNKDFQISGNPTLEVSRINKDSEFHEILLAFRSGNQLVFHLLAENTPLGNRQNHNLRHYYFGETENDDDTKQTLKLNKGVLQFNFGKNPKSDRNFPIYKLVNRHEELRSGSRTAVMGANRFQLTAYYELVSKEKKYP